MLLHYIWSEAAAADYSGIGTGAADSPAMITVSPSALTMFSHRDVIRINVVHFVQVNDASASRHHPLRRWG